MGHRNRLLVAALTAALGTVAVGFLAVLPLVIALRTGLQERYDAAAPIPEAARRVGTEYAGAAVWTLVAVAIALFCAGAACVAATTPPARRTAVPRDLGRLGAGLLVVQTPLSVMSGLWGSYSSVAIVGGLALGAIGVVVLGLERGPKTAHVLGCLLAAVATLILARPAFLLLPIFTGVAGVLLAAAVTRLIETPRMASEVRP